MLISEDKKIMNWLFNRLYVLSCYIGRYSIGALFIATIGFPVLLIINLYEIIYSILQNVINLFRDVWITLLDMFKNIYNCFNITKNKKIWDNRYNKIKNKNMR